jgi:hypothetical protein
MGKQFRWIHAIMIGQASDDFKLRMCDKTAAGRFQARFSNRLGAVWRASSWQRA